MTVYSGAFCGKKRSLPGKGIHEWKCEHFAEITVREEELAY